MTFQYGIELLCLVKVGSGEGHRGVKVEGRCVFCSGITLKCLTDLSSTHVMLQSKVVVMF